MTTYEVLRKIASGGNATVYAARAVSLGITRTVALKKPHPHLLDDPAFEQAFRREAAVAVRLRHPNVVQVLDVIEHEGVPTLVLELGLEANPTSVARAVRAFEKDPKERASAAPPAASPASNPAADIAPPAIAPITEKLAGNAQSSSPGYGSVSASAERPVADDLPTTRDLVVQAPSIPPTLSASSASVGAPTRSTRSKLLALGVATTLGLAVAAVAYRTSRAPPATPIERPVEVPSLSPSEKPTASTGDLASSRSSDSPSAVVPQRTSATASTPPLTQDAGSASTRPPVR